ncbi:sigma factor-like helix-turn-helix DNA-binding protein [Sphaerimonospora mesophila]|uniref:sigma factor-like helix-turn-helix DNA-binding protein n=1 Tax=Sphaerimonospora mesophila TaxID=37483 RepID=UPI0006E16339
MRGGDGRYTRDPETAVRDAEACRLRARGLSYEQIAEQLGVSRSNAYLAVQRAIADIVREPAEEVRQLELVRLDEMHRAALGVLEATHYVVDKGKVVMWDGQPLIDDGPVLAAVDRMLKIQARRAALLGLDAEKKVSLSGGVTYEVVGVDPAQLK